MSFSSRLPMFAIWYDRLSWWRLVAARRIAAVLLVLLSAGLAARSELHDDEIDVIIAAHDLQPGSAIQISDILVRKRPQEQAPVGATAEPAQFVGRTVAGPVRSGEVLTDTRVITPRLAQLATGIPDARVVPVRLPDQALVDMLRPGDIVDVITVPKTEDATTKQTGIRPPEVLARSAVVVLVSELGGPRPAEGRVTLIAMPDNTAQTVAAVTLVQAVTVLLR